MSVRLLPPSVDDERGPCGRAVDWLAERPALVLLGLSVASAAIGDVSSGLAALLTGRLEDSGSD